MQNVLSPQQVEAFHHAQFVMDQVRDFKAFIDANPCDVRLVVDMGGGCGFFARKLTQDMGLAVKVIDMDLASVEACRAAGTEAVFGDALQPEVTGSEDIVCFNLILHHLVADSEQATRNLQRLALAAWHQQTRYVFVNEYIYDSVFGNLSGWLIFQITKSRFLSTVGRLVSRAVPSLRANTFGVGVRFRSHEEWRQLFSEAGFDVKASTLGADEGVSAARRLLLIRKVRRDSFLLQPRPARPA
jgi:hypothetical protein